MPIDEKKWNKANEKSREFLRKAKEKAIEEEKERKSNWDIFELQEEAMRKKQQAPIKGNEKRKDKAKLLLLQGAVKLGEVALTALYYYNDSTSSNDSSKLSNGNSNSKKKTKSKKKNGLDV